MQTGEAQVLANRRASNRKECTGKGQFASGAAGKRKRGTEEALAGCDEANGWRPLVLSPTPPGGRTFPAADEQEYDGERDGCRNEHRMIARAREPERGPCDADVSQKHRPALPACTGGPQP